MMFYVSRPTFVQFLLFFVLYLHRKEAVNQGKVVRRIVDTGIFDQVIKMKYDVPNDNIAKLDTYYHDIDEAINSVA